MDFTLGEADLAVRETATSIFDGYCSHERLKQVESTDDRFDRDLWAALADAGLLGIAMAEEFGGTGLGYLALAVLAEEVGRCAAALPLVPALVLGAAPINRYGSDALRKRWLPGVASGALVLSAAAFAPDGALAASPSVAAVPVVATRTAQGWTLEGERSFVPAATVSDGLVVAAAAGTHVGLFVVETDAPGCAVVPQDTTSGMPEGLVTFEGLLVSDDAVLVAPGPAASSALQWLLERATAAFCVQLAAACRSAVRLTATYTSERQQFGKAIATFQAVGQRAADAYIDTEAVHLTAWQAAWRLAEELPTAEEVAIAAFWADDGAQRVVHAAEHLHGGVGVDRDYPLHRYFLMVKHLSQVLGGATPNLVRLGELMAGRSV